MYSCKNSKKVVNYQKAINNNIIFGGVKMIKVLANDGLQKEAIDKLTSMGFEVVNFHYDKDELGNILRKFDALIIRSATKVTSDVIDIEAGGKLKLIIRAGVGIDNIDVKYANEKGIIVKYDDKNVTLLSDITYTLNNTTYKSNKLICILNRIYRYIDQTNFVVQFIHMFCAFV